MAILHTLTAPPAAAHASLVASSPKAGAGVVQPPAQLVMKFTEPLVRGPSRIRVLDQGGRDVGEGNTQPVAGDPTAMQRELGLLAPGIYTVEWTTVSPVDGHTLSGSYNFAVGGATVGNATVAENPVSSEGWLGLAGRFVALGGLALWVGAAVLTRVVARTGIDRRRLRWLVRVGPPLAAVGTVVSLLSSAIVASGSLASLDALVAGSQSVRLRLVLVAAAAAATLLGRRLPVVWGLLASVAVLAEASSGHAAASASPTATVLTFAAHLAAVGVWLFAVAAAALSGRNIRAVLAAVAGSAISSAGLVGVTGVSVAAMELTEPADLLTTGYGRVVLAKGAAFGIVVACGALQQRRRTRGRDPDRLHTAVRAEGVAAGVALVLATVLVGFPNPPREIEAAAGATDLDAQLAAVVEAPAVSVADVDGAFTVGLTVLPPQPGPVDLRVSVLPITASDGLRDVTALATTPAGRQVRVALTDSCGVGCFRADALLDDATTWRFDVSATSNRGPIAVSAQIPLPTPDGSDQFERMLVAMEGVGSLRVSEDLRESQDGEAIVSRYRFRAPDAMVWDVNDGGSTRVALGDTGYIRLGAGNPWETYSWPGDGFSWPGDYYRGFFANPAAVRLLGRDTVDGADTTVIGFVLPDYPAWFRVWVGEDGLIRRLNMLMDRHMMDQLYGPYDEPVEIEAPVTRAA